MLVKGLDPLAPLPPNIFAKGLPPLNIPPNIPPGVVPAVVLAELGKVGNNVEYDVGVLVAVVVTEKMRVNFQKFHIFNYLLNFYEKILKAIRIIQIRSHSLKKH